METKKRLRIRKRPGWKKTKKEDLEEEDDLEEEEDLGEEEE